MMRNVLIAMTLLLSLAVQAMAQSTVHLHQTAGSAGPVVLLSDVADLTGDEAIALSGIVVAKFPESAQTVVVEMADVRQALAKAKVNWAFVSLKGFRACQVHRELQEKDVQPMQVDPAEVFSNVERALDVTKPTSLKAAIVQLMMEYRQVERDELRIKFREQDKDILARSAVIHRFEMTPRSATGLGRVPIEVIQYDGDQPTDRMTISVSVSQQIQGIVSNQTIARGQTITDEMVDIKTVWVESLAEPPMRDEALVVGQVASSRIPVGELVSSDDIAPTVLIERGEYVTVRAIVGEVVVRTVARATEEGAKGQVIRLRQEDSRETFLATVTGRRQAVVTDVSQMKNSK